MKLVNTVAQLAAPLIVSASLVIASPMPELTLAGLQMAIENFLFSYLALSAPHWIWLAVSGVIEASDNSTFGGLIGLNILLVCVALLVFISSSHEAANGWLIYLLGIPFAIALGVAGAALYAPRKIN